ncbi:MAG TPA: arylesterase [Kofleriaceae bacterium]|nr:arylesterase [Kofleriaceae bacterium]
MTPATNPAATAVASLLAAAALLAACDRQPAKRADRAGPAEQGTAGAGAADGARADAPAPSPQPSPQPSLVFLGDSLTAGFGLAADQSYPALLQGEADRAGLHLRVVNAGRSGDTTAGGASRVSYYLRPEVAPRGLVVWLGANDIMRGLPVDQIEKNLRDLIGKAHAFDPALPVYLVQMRAFPNLGADYARSFEAIYPRVAKSENATLVPFPMDDVAGHPDLNQPDGIHPTAEGTVRVAASLWKALGPHLAAR